MRHPGLPGDQLAREYLTMLVKSHRCIEVNALTHAKEGRDARALNFKDVVIGADGEVVAGQGERHVR